MQVPLPTVLFKYRVPNTDYCNLATRAGGAAIFVREESHCQQLLTIKIKADGCEDVWAELRINDKESLVVGSVYRHSSTSIKGFEDAFVHVIKTFKTNPNYIVLGEFNINYKETPLSPNVLNCADHISSIGCIQLIDKPTRITSTFNTIIDHIYVNTALLDQILPVIFHDDISDHLPISAEFRCRTQKKSSERPITRLLNQKNIELFLSKLNQKLNKPEMQHNCNLNSLIKSLSDLTDLCCSKKMLSRKHFEISRNPWITSGVLASIRHENKLFTK